MLTGAPRARSDASPPPPPDDQWSFVRWVGGPVARRRLGGRAGDSIRPPPSPRRCVSSSGVGRLCRRSVNNHCHTVVGVGHRRKALMTAAMTRPPSPSLCASKPSMPSRRLRPVSLQILMRPHMRPRESGSEFPRQEIRPHKAASQCRRRRGCEKDANNTHCCRTRSQHGIIIFFIAMENRGLVQRRDDINNICFVLFIISPVFVHKIGKQVTHTRTHTRLQSATVFFFRGTRSLRLPNSTTTNRII